MTAGFIVGTTAVFILMNTITCFTYRSRAGGVIATRRISSRLNAIFGVLAICALIYAISLPYGIGLVVAGFILCVTLPDLICDRYQINPPPAPIIAPALRGMTEAIGWIALVLMVVWSFMRGSIIHGSIIDLIPTWLFFLGFIVFVPIYRVAACLDERWWPRLLWPLLACGVAEVILRFSHVSF
ncbi:MAG TPA: hypothetical protein VL981_10715 [Candidatus Methylacidiphilales bacterium]|nr:hypothetical protein [Candidatus Methylacidiphilales bacterium]